MRTFRTLAIGWVTGAAFLVLLEARARPRDPATVPVISHGSIAVVPQRGLAPVQPRLAERAMARSSGALLIPVYGTTARDLKDTFLEARGSRIHHAIDILAPRGTPVVAVADGTIRKLFNSAGGGITIYQFDVAEKRNFYYAHLDRYADGLQEGQQVKQGTVIGYVGTTGNAPPGTPHLHFSIEDLPPTKEWWKGSPVNPYELLR